MSRLYGQQHRELQDAFSTRKLADRIEQLACRTEFDEESAGFIEAVDMFFLATVDHNGRPTVSYKGGDPGFVKILDSTTLVFPSFDGNGMFLSMGNLALHRQVGMLFISFSVRIGCAYRAPPRFRGRFSVLEQYYKEADLIVRVKLSELWQNCPRYVHRFQKIQASRYVPREAKETPLAEWKRVDVVQDVLSPPDAARAQGLGTIGAEEWANKVKAGDPTA